MATRKTAGRSPRSRKAAAPSARRAKPRAVAQPTAAPAAAAAHAGGAAAGSDRPSRGASHPTDAKAHGGPDLFGLSMPWLAPAGESGANSMLPLSPQRLLDLQQDYLQRVGSMWSTFFEHPDKASEPIKDPRFSDPAWQKNSLASLYARAYLLNA